MTNQASDNENLLMRIAHAQPFTDLDFNISQILARGLERLPENNGSQDWMHNAVGICLDAITESVQPEPQEPTDDELWLTADDEFRANVYPTDAIRFARAVLARWGRPSIEVVPVAEPEPQRPTLADEAYVAFVQICKGNSDDAGTYEADEELVRRALKRLNDLERRPTIEPVLAPPTEADIYDILAEVFNGDPVPAMRRALEPWGRPAIEPVPIAERLPGPEDCDAKGRCWMLGKIYTDWRLTSVISLGIPNLSYCFSHWLPYHALPLPSAINGK